VSGLRLQPEAARSVVVRGGFGLFLDTPAIVPFLDNSSSLAAASTANNGPKVNFQWRDADDGWSFLVFASYADRWPQSGNGSRYEE